MSSEMEVTEIIRRRLFEWGGHDSGDEALRTISAYADWASEYASQIGGLGGENPRELFKACYPFHPSVISVFERKWQSLPRFQRTRGVLRLLALWVSRNWQEDFRRVANEPLITLGSAPLDDQTFRDALFEELGSDQLSVPVTADIIGKKNANAVRLDREANEEIKKGRLHQKVATIIFFESNGGQSLNKAEASESEIRAALGGPDVNLSNVETVLEGLAGSCFYLRWDRNRYRFGLQANLNQVLVQRKGSITTKAVEEQIKKSITEVFNQRPKGIELPRCFPTQTNDIPDKAQLSFVVLGPDHAIGSTETLPFVEKLVRECGNSGRVFKTGLIVCAADTTDSFTAAARHFLAWQEIQEDEDTVNDLDESQRRALTQNLERARKDLKESVWRAYRHVLFLGKDNKIVPKDLGQITSSMASSLPEYILNDLQQTDQITDRIADRKLISYWPPALTEWSTKAARDAFFASPALPRLLNPDLIKRTIADGVTGKVLGYARRDASGKLALEKFGESLSELEVELSDDVYILKAEDAQKLLEPPRLAEIRISPDRVALRPGEKTSFSCQGVDQYGHPYEISSVVWGATDLEVGKNGQVTAPSDGGQYRVTAKAGDFFAEAFLSVSSQPAAATAGGASTSSHSTVRWSGHVPPQKWMNFYTKVLSRFASNSSLKLQVSFEVASENQQANGKAEEVRSSLRDLGLTEDVDVR